MHKRFWLSILACVGVGANAQRLTAKDEGSVAPSPELQQVVDDYAQRFGYQGCKFTSEATAGSRTTQIPEANFSAQDWYYFHLFIVGAMYAEKGIQDEATRNEVEQYRTNLKKHSILDTEQQVLAILLKNGGPPRMTLYMQDGAGTLTLGCELMGKASL